MSLEAWAKKGWLRRHKSSAGEIADLLAVVNRDLRDSMVTGLTADWRLNIAYNAALQAATAALAASGYRAAREAHHLRVIKSLEFTVCLDQATVDQLDMFRRKRNISDYERSGMVSDKEANEMHDLAELILSTVVEWLEVKHPDYLADP